MENEIYLSVRNLTKRFEGKNVLDGVSFDVKKGEVLVIIGPSGCGKSTLLRCINALERIDGGEIVFDGKKVAYDAASLVALRAKIGMVFQSYDLFPHMTVFENICLAPVKV